MNRGGANTSGFFIRLTSLIVSFLSPFGGAGGGRCGSMVNWQVWLEWWWRCSVTEDNCGNNGEQHRSQLNLTVMQRKLALSHTNQSEQPFGSFPPLRFSVTRFSNDTGVILSKFTSIFNFIKWGTWYQQAPIVGIWCIYSQLHFALCFSFANN